MSPSKRQSLSKQIISLLKEKNGCTIHELLESISATEKTIISIIVQLRKSGDIRAEQVSKDALVNQCFYKVINFDKSLQSVDSMTNGKLSNILINEEDLQWMRYYRKRLAQRREKCGQPPSVLDPL